MPITNEVIVVYYIIVGHKIYEFSSRSKAEKFYTDKATDELNPFATQDEDLAKLIAYDTESVF